MQKADAVAWYGSQAKVAAVLKIKPPSVSQWPGLIPEARAARLSKLTKGKLKYDPALYTTNDT